MRSLQPGISIVISLKIFNGIRPTSPPERVFQSMYKNLLSKEHCTRHSEVNNVKMLKRYYEADGEVVPFWSVMRCCMMTSVMLSLQA